MTITDYSTLCWSWCHLSFFSLNNSFVLALVYSIQVFRAQTLEIGPARMADDSDINCSLSQYDNLYGAIFTRLCLAASAEKSDFQFRMVSELEEGLYGRGVKQAHRWPG